MPTVYYEYVIKGDEDKLCAYLDGFLRGKGVKDGFFLAKDHPFHRHMVKEMIKYHGAVGHLICVSKLRPLVQTAVRQGVELGLEIIEEKKIAKCSFRFEFDTANRNVAGTIKRALGSLPAGGKLVQYNPEEVEDPTAKGPEGYAPLHAYVFKGEGTVEGTVAGVLKSHAKLSGHEFISCTDIDIHY